MIKFFRKIRQNLLIENLSAEQAGKTGKYLKYAIGEIVLVVIGILIALQINTWNKNRIAKTVEFDQVIQLLADAKSDSIFFKSRLDFYTTTDSLQRLVLAMYNPESRDSIVHYEKLSNSIFGNRLAYQSRVIFNNKDAVEIIKNDSIKKYLKSYYAKYEYVSTAIELSNRMLEQHGIPLYLKYANDFKISASDSLMRGYLELIKHKEIQPNIELSQSFILNALYQVNEFNDEIALFIQKLEVYKEKENVQ